ncbi:hypothetical protein B9479_008065, partial [Cryptococcus floricola]
THDSPLFTTMLLAWSIAEVVRYSFYTLSLLPPASVPSPITSLLTWLRYTSFLVLYPLGAGSEAFLSFSTLPPFALLAGKAIGLLSGGAVRDLVVKSKLGREVLWWVAKGGKNLVSEMAHDETAAYGTNTASTDTLLTPFHTHVVPTTDVPFGRNGSHHVTQAQFYAYSLFKRGHVFNILHHAPSRSSSRPLLTGLTFSRTPPILTLPSS